MALSVHKGTQGQSGGASSRLRSDLWTPATEKTWACPQSPGARPPLRFPLPLCVLTCRQSPGLEGIVALLLGSPSPCVCSPCWQSPGLEGIATRY